MLEVIIMKLTWTGLIAPDILPRRNSKFSLALYTPVNSPSFSGRLPVSMVISRSPGFHFSSPGFWTNTIFCCFFKTIKQIRFISFIYYIPWNGVTLTSFLSFYLFSYHQYLYCHAAFGKKHLALSAQLSRSSVLLRTHDML